ncbi:MAG: hypothetical protein NC433_06350 [Clostridiales bacterium]|nr:hypothetical protein [Clostridiales bacterium]
MERLQILLSFIGGVSNAIAAICAMVAIKVTVKNYNSDREEQTKEKLNIKFRELYKQAVIDDFLETEDKKIHRISDRLYEMTQTRINEDDIQELYNNMTPILYDCLRSAEIIKFFNRNLYGEIKKIIENIFDVYGEIINKAIEHKFISINFERPIITKLTELRSAIYKCYIDENYDRIDK